MTDQELRYLLALTFLPHIGSITARKLIAYTGSGEAVFFEKKSNLMKIPGIGNILAENTRSREVFDKADSEMDFMRKKNIKIKLLKRLVVYAKTIKNVPEISNAEAITTPVNPNEL